MHRWTALALGMLVVAALVVALVGTRVRRPNGSRQTTVPTATASSRDQGVGGSFGTVDRKAGVRPDSPNSDNQPDSGPIPPLPAGAPSSITIGVIQFVYSGAELAPSTAPSKADAYQKAQSVLPLAKQDFAHAVSQGDPGSAADVGDVPRGILEPAIEYVLFTMSPNSVHDGVLDTPRGYWLVRRIR